MPSIPTGTQDDIKVMDRWLRDHPEDDISRGESVGWSGMPFEATRNGKLMSRGNDLGQMMRILKEHFNN
jgi:hypothetical protein